MEKFAQIIWTFEAKNDLLNIVEYIAKDSFQNAKKINALILGAVEKLERYPEVGSIISIDSVHIYRRILIKSFRIIYTYQNNNIYVAVIQHQKRLLPQQMNFIEKYL